MRFLQIFVPTLICMVGTWLVMQGVDKFLVYWYYTRFCKKLERDRENAPKVT